jgi:hypothetical protein
MGLPEYMAHLDAGRESEALALMEDDLSFLLALPTKRVTGSSRADFERYVGGRKPAARVHNIQRHSLTGDFELAYGTVTEAGLPTGSFMSVAVLSAEGKIQRYQSYFDTEFSLIDWPVPSVEAQLEVAGSTPSQDPT